MRRAYEDRVDAGRVLADALRDYAGRADLIVLAIPRGGVPVGFEVARALGAPLDVLIVRKLGFPGQPELAMGAVASGGVRVMNPLVEREVPADIVDIVAERELGELRRREKMLRGERPPPDLEGRHVIVVDDGLATGASMRAAIAALRARRPSGVTVAIPVAPAHTVDVLRGEVDDVVCPWSPLWFGAIGQFYEDFGQVSDEEAREILERAWQTSSSEASSGEAAGAGTEKRQVGAGRLGTPEEIAVSLDRVELAGSLTRPAGARALVLFAHGSGSSRKSPRNRFVARALNEGGLATLLFDLLTPEEEVIDLRTRELRFDIDLLAERLIGAIDWVDRQPQLEGISLGLFGASTGAAAALIAAAARSGRVGAVVSRGGRPDLAAGALPRVEAPTLLIVGEWDRTVIELNQIAARSLRAPHELAIVPRSTHLFEEPGALEEVAELAADWFSRHLLEGARTV